jgi:hypothetical protein
MGWRDIAGEHADVFRSKVLTALAQAYEENCQRFAPEDLGDNNITFGVNVSQNFRFLLAQELDGIAGLSVRHPRNSFVVETGGGHIVHFYKAPPGVFDLGALRFDSSATQIELVRENSEQLAFDLRQTTEPGSSSSHIVVVHFGDPDEGFRRADVGAPLLSSTEGLQWAWTECLSELAFSNQNRPEWEHGQGLEEIDVDFGLRLRDNDEGEDDVSRGQLRG